MRISSVFALLVFGLNRSCMNHQSSIIVITMTGDAYHSSIVREVEPSCQNLADSRTRGLADWAGFRKNSGKNSYSTSAIILAEYHCTRSVGRRVHSTRL